MWRVRGRASRVGRVALVLVLALAFLSPSFGVMRGVSAATGGALSAWGDNEFGQLGDGTQADRDEPVRVSGTGTSGLAFVAIAAGDFSSMGLTADGTVYAWGDNVTAQLGAGAPGFSTVPLKVAGTGPGGIALIAVAGGLDHSLGLAANGAAYAWGRNDEGQLGDGTSGPEAMRTTPQSVPATGPGRIVLTFIAAGAYHSLGLTANGTAYAWGVNTYGQLGNGTSGNGAIQATPVAVTGTGPGGIALAAVDAGWYHNVASGDAGDPYCAGFVDLSADDPACPAIAALTQRGVIRGYATQPPTFGPGDNAQRAQMAAFLVRALGWQGRPTGPRTFTDLNGLAPELRTASLIIANACDGQGNCVARGYGDGRFGPTDNVSHAQVIAFITRAFGLDPVQTWQLQPGVAQPHSGVPAIHDTEVRTFVHYAGSIAGAPNSAAGWNAPASRAWVATVLYQALTVQP